MNTQHLNPLFLLRTRECLSLRELSQEIGLTVKTLWKIEHGENSRINSRTLKKLKAFFHIETDVFYQEYMTWRDQYYNNTKGI